MMRMSTLTAARAAATRTTRTTRSIRRIIRRIITPPRGVILLGGRMILLAVTLDLFRRPQTRQPRGGPSQQRRHPRLLRARPMTLMHRRSRLPLSPKHIP